MGDKRPVDLMKIVSALSVASALIQVIVVRRSLTTWKGPGCHYAKTVARLLPIAASALVQVFVELDRLSSLLRDNWEQVRRGEGTSGSLSASGFADTEGTKVSASIFKLRGLIKTARYSFEHFAKHICPPLGPHDRVCRHLQGLPRVYAIISSVFTKTTPNTELMDVARDFSTNFVLFDKWLSEFLDELQKAMDARLGLVRLSSDETVRVTLDIRELLRVDPMACLRQADARAHARQCEGH
ncbi:hypothetical protein K523DRAFT_109593 [Schizophyllum commune Tattone D]|nr:hypothetical protein K525DRAFT_271514 [Schizophyllum commune Loenen D]KAI5825074.1 hypothetical protein K523DRAFT_109593 [Schizophyllum commune Tattone D]